ncbi:MAG: hypothetical protein IKP10_06710, partial [Clostridia bacterium]|nr:hypothetical protein [Clostridia bacterium]
MLSKSLIPLIAGLLVGAAFLTVTIIALIRLYKKAGQHPWAVFVPIYGEYVKYEIGDCGVLFIAGLIACVALSFPAAFFAASKPLIAVIIGGAAAVFGLVLNILWGIRTAKRFEKSTAFGVLLLGLLQPIGIWILGFGRARMRREAVRTAAPASAAPAVPAIRAFPAVTPTVLAGSDEDDEDDEE